MITIVKLSLFFALLSLTYVGGDTVILAAENRNEHVEYVTVEPPEIKDRMDQMVLALSLVSNKNLLINPTLVTLKKESNNPCIVEFFAVSKKTDKIGSSYATVESDNKGVVTLRESKANSISQESVQISEGKAVVSAAVFLKSIGCLPESFIVEVTYRAKNELTITFHGTPRAPGRFSVVVVTPNSLRYYPGK